MAELQLSAKVIWTVRDSKNVMNKVLLCWRGAGLRFNAVNASPSTDRRSLCRSGGSDAIFGSLWPVGPNL
jgi:hypothetical protein